MCDDEDVIDDDRKKKDKEEPEDDINVPTADLYSYAIAITQMRWRKQDVIEYLDSSVLFYIYHSLCMADDVWISYHSIGYDLNLLGTNSENGRKLRVSIRIFIATINIWKDIHRIALMGDQTEIHNKPDNHLDIHPLNATT